MYRRIIKQSQAFLVSCVLRSTLSPPVPEVNGYLLHGPEDLEPLPQIGPGGPLGDSAHVHHPALLHLAKLVLLQVPSLLLAALAVLGEGGRRGRGAVAPAA